MNFRWHVTITYRTDLGPTDVDHAIMELEEIQDLVERGPDFGTIERIVAAYAFGDGAKTVEQAIQE